MAPKQISANSLLGQQGVNLLERVVLSMGYVWYPSGQLEAGIDGVIEVRDPKTGAVTNCILQVQSRATSKEFDSESAESFAYLCDEKDLDYWLSGNTPVILIRSRPATDEAYWVSVKDYFSEPKRRKSRKIVFNKARDRFDANCAGALAILAVPRSSGLYLGPTPRQERVFTNLLRIAKYPAELHVATTDLGSQRAVAQALHGHTHATFIYTNKTIRAFHDLSDPVWRAVCDAGTHETFGTEEWAHSDDDARQREFVELLTGLLREKLFTLGVVTAGARPSTYYVKASRDGSPIHWSYQALEQKASRAVYRRYFNTRNIEKVSFHRHSAIEAGFVRFERDWYLQISPTYHFTYDGFRPDGFHEEHLSGIKRLENNSAILGQLVMWAAMLSREADLMFPAFEMLQFGDLVSLEAPAGIDEKLWLQTDESAPPEQDPDPDLLLF